MASEQKSPIAAAIQKGLQARDLNAALEELDEVRLSTAAEAHAVAQALLRIEGWPVEAQIDAVDALCRLMQGVNSREAVDGLVREAMTRLAARFETLRRREAKTCDRLLFALKIMALFQYVAAVPLIVSAIRDEFCIGSFWWSVVFGSMEHCREMRVQVCRQLTDPLPRGFAAVAFLDMANGTWINDTPHVAEVLHPFDSEEGSERLESWLTSSSPDEFSYALSATAALPFISSPRREQLLALAMDHPDAGIQVEAAWASAKIGSESGIMLLQRYCTDANTAIRAARLLQELGREEALPPLMQDPEFVATATMCQWLSHPSECGRAPDRIEVVEQRELYWPPIADRTTLFLFCFEYDASDAARDGESGFGLVGGLTPWSFFSLVKPDWRREDMIALHCSWESRLNESAIADKPEDYSVDHGHMLLRKANPDWPG